MKGTVTVIKNNSIIETEKKAKFKILILGCLFFSSIIVADFKRDSDTRNILTGSLMPSEDYCDQPYTVITKDGNWLCILTTSSGRESSSGLHVISTISTDKGKTWSVPVDIESAGENRSYWAVPYITPYGRIYAFYGWEQEPTPGHLLQTGKNHRYVFKYSDDSGKSWSKKRYEIPMRLTSVDKPDYRHPFWGIDSPITHNGSMYFAFSKFAERGHGVGWVFKSENILYEKDPEKILFKMLPEGEDGIRNDELGRLQDEHNTVSLGEHGIFMVFRRTGFMPCQSYSRDDGQTWSTPQFMTYQPGGRTIKHPRACPKIFKTSGGKYLFWFHNNYTQGTRHNRNPVFVTGGVLKDDGYIYWAQPELLLYDPYVSEAPEPSRGISYPGFIEQDGEFWVAATDKTNARVHKIDRKLLDGLWSQNSSSKITTDGLLCDLSSSEIDNNLIDMPKGLNLTSQSGLIIEMLIQLDSLESGKLIVDSRDDGGRGILIQTSDGHCISAPESSEIKGSVRLDISDGENSLAWDVDAGLIKAGRLHHLVFIVDSGPKIISVILDGQYCDGQMQRPRGWGRYDKDITKISGNEKAKVSTSLKHLRIYNRYLRTSEAVSNYNNQKSALSSKLDD